jgi:hypothetical protein
MKRITTILLLLCTISAFGQSDTAAVKALINSNFPDNTSNYITPARLRTVSLELMRSSANLAEENTFLESVSVEDSIKSDVGFYVWNGVAYEEISGGGDTANWAISGGFISPVNFTNKLNVDTARFAGNIYPDGSGVNIGRSGAKFDTVFANVFDGVGASLWQFSGDTLKPDLSHDFFSVSVSDADTVSTVLVGKVFGEQSVALITSSPLGTASVSTRKGRISATAPIITFNGTDYIRFNSDSIVLDGNVHAEDTVFADVIDKSYGEMGFRDSSYTVPLTIDVPAWATNVGNDLWQQSAIAMKDVVYDGDSIVVNRSGTYYISGHLSVAGSNGDVLRSYTYRNGTALCLCSPVVSLVNSRIITLQLNTDIAQLSSGDVLKVFIENIGTSNDVAAISGKLTLHRID